MVFENKTQFFINEDILYRSNRLYIKDDVLYTEPPYEWTLYELYEATLDTSVSIYNLVDVEYNGALLQPIQTDNILFNKGDKFVCLSTTDLYSINGLPNVYLNFEYFRYSMQTYIDESPTGRFAEVVKINELEYIDYLYGRD